MVSHKDNFEELLTQYGNSTENSVMDIMKGTLEDKRSLTANQLLRISANSYLFPSTVLAIAKSYPEDKEIIDICLNAAEEAQDQGLRAAVSLIHNPKNKQAASNLLVAMTFVGKNPYMYDETTFLQTSRGQELVLSIINHYSNDKSIADKACQIINNFADTVSDSKRVCWTTNLVEANPGNRRVIDTAFAQAEKISSWKEKTLILSSLAKNNSGNREILNKIRLQAENTDLQSYKGILLALSCPLDKKMSEKLIKIAADNDNNTKIDLYSAILSVHPNNQEIAVKILNDPYSYQGGGYHTGYTVSSVFSKILEANPDNNKLRKLTIARAREISENLPDYQKKYITEAINTWSTIQNTTSLKTNSYTN